jgi:hypothetical protein
MHFIIFFILLLVSTANTSAIARSFLHCPKCDIEVLKYTENHLANLSRKEVAEFLCTFHSSCSNNVEYSEYSNELLFRVLDKYTDDFIWVIANTQVCKKYIYERLSTPLFDVDVNALKVKVQEIRKGDNNVRKEIIEALSKIPRE